MSCLCRFAHRVAAVQSGLGYTNQNISGSLALRDGCQAQTGHGQSGEILQTVDSHIDAVGQQLALNFLGEKALPANLAERLRGDVPLVEIISK